MPRLKSAAVAAMLAMICWLAWFGAAAPAWAGQGRLYLMGMGPGDPDLMTVRAQKILAQAEVVLAMKWLCRSYADLLKGKEVHPIPHGLYLDKIGSPRRLSPEELKAKEESIRRTVRSSVAAGKTVVVLAGGDPILYSPHVGFLEEFKDLNPEVVPGLSCFNAGNAALKKSVNRGSRSHSVILTSGVGADQDRAGQDALTELAKTRSTLVFFTMRVHLPQLVEKLKKTLPGDTPVAIVCYAGMKDKEKVITGTLDTIMKRTQGGNLPFEHLIYVGDFLR